jgi:rhodanese-related sulfurtransferase
MVYNRWTALLGLALIQLSVATQACTFASAKSKKTKTEASPEATAPVPESVTKSKKSDITVAETVKLLEENKAYLVDVRELEEILDDGMAKPAKWLAMEEIQTRGNRYEDAIRTWPKSTSLIFYCVSGKRARIAADHFKELGYKVSVMGGFKDWTGAGLPTRPKP